MSSDDIVLSVKNVSKYFEMYDKPRHRLQQMLLGPFGKKYYREFWALRDISFEVHRGECVGVIGRNGAGKSTLLQIITGTLQPTAGSVEINGRIAALLELGSGFNPEFTGKENVYLNAAILGLSHAEIDARYQDILDFADIGNFIDQPVKTYSSGMMVRLAFAVNAFVDPDILIVDEALAVGDIRFQKKCFQRISALKKQGTTILLVSHDLDSIRQFCSYVIWINDGMIRQIGNTRETVENYIVYMNFGDECISSQETPSPEITPNFSPDSPASEKELLPIPHDSAHQESFAPGYGEITHYGFFDETGKATFFLSHSQKVTCRFKARILKTIKRPLYGLVFETSKGSILVGTNNYCTEDDFAPILGPQDIEVTFQFHFPELQNGKYFFALAISDGVQRDHKRIHRIADLGPIEFLSGKRRQEQPGVIKLPDCKITEKR